MPSAVVATSALISIVEQQLLQVLRGIGIGGVACAGCASL